MSALSKQLSEDRRWLCPTVSATGAEDVTNATRLALTAASKFIFLSSAAQAACVTLKPIKSDKSSQAGH